MSRKNRDKYNRFRSKIIAFRVSEEENKTLETKVALSGLDQTRLFNSLYRTKGLCY